MKINRISMDRRTDGFSWNVGGERNTDISDV